MNQLQVMKFGGTSVGDAACIRRTAEIIAAKFRQVLGRAHELVSDWDEQGI